ncbi:MAG: hypothetical protein R2854_04245 [Caldilineaceae bacterium]
MVHRLLNGVDFLFGALGCVLDTTDASLSQALRMAETTAPISSALNAPWKRGMPARPVKTTRSTPAGILRQDERIARQCRIDMGHAATTVLVTGCAVVQ